MPMLELSSLQKGQILGEPGVRIEKIYFPIRSVVSTVTRMKDGSAVEVGFAGHEGFSALGIIFGSLTTPHSTVVQISDSAYVMRTESFLEQLDADAALRTRALAYAEYSYIAATQFAACNRLHPLEERYSRWILMADDRVGGGEFMLTQDYSAQMLGVRRAGVTITAGSMSKSGLISYRRGRIVVLDRERLEEVACECYGVVNAELRRLLGYGPRRPADQSPSAKFAGRDGSIRSVR